MSSGSNVPPDPMEAQPPVPVVDHGAFNPEDTQRNPTDPNHIVDPQLRPRPHYSSHMVFKLSGNRFPGRILYDITNTSATITFAMPEDQRAALVLTITLPRHMDRAYNPTKIATYNLRITVPARYISDLAYEVLSLQVLADDFQIPAADRVFSNGSPRELASLTFSTSTAYVMGSAIPPLITQELTDTVNNFIRECTTRSASPGADLNFSLAMRRTVGNNYTQNRVDSFSECVVNEHHHDPATDCPHDRVTICRRCQELGDEEHMRGHTAAACPYHDRPRRCYHCRQLGHVRANCPTVTCSRCRAIGHSAFACPVPERCSLCGQEGHARHQCQVPLSRRLFNQYQAIDYHSDNSPPPSEIDDNELNQDAVD